MSESAPPPAPEFDEEAAITRARVRSAQFHETFIKPAARESAGVALSKPSGCQCKTPRPSESAVGAFVCKRCREPLRTSSDGRPFRRLPGDLDTLDQVNARKVLEVAEMSTAEMRGLVAQLPTAQQKRLAKLPRKQFEKVARRMIRTHLAVQASALTAQVGPNARRRLERRGAEYADVIDDIAAITARKRSEGK